MAAFGSANAAHGERCHVQKNRKRGRPRKHQHQAEPLSQSPQENPNPKPQPEEAENLGGISPSSETVEAEREERFDAVAETVPAVISESGAEPAAEPAVVEAVAESRPESIQVPVVTSLQRETVAYYLDLTFKAIAIHSGKQWELDKKELAMSTEVTTPLVNKWLPSWLGESQYKEEIAFCIVMFGIVAAKSETVQRLIGQVLSFQKPKPPQSAAGIRTPDASANRVAVSRFS